MQAFLRKDAGRGAHSRCSHTCGLKSVFPEAHVLGKNVILILFRHLRMTELCEAPASLNGRNDFFDSLQGPYPMGYGPFVTDVSFLRLLPLRRGQGVVLPDPVLHVDHGILLHAVVVVPLVVVPHDGDMQLLERRIRFGIVSTLKRKRQSDCLAISRKVRAGFVAIIVI